MLDRVTFQRLLPFSTALALTCPGPCLLQAQDAAYRASVHQLRAELDSTHSIAQVDAVAADWSATGPAAVSRLGAAFIELRRGILDNNRLELISAWERFDQVVRLHPDWPYARLGLAEAALEIYSRRYPLPAMYDDVAGGTHYNGYEIQMKRTLKAEPTFQPAITWLAGTLSEEGDREQPASILGVLQYIADSTSSSDPRIQIILARAERLHGDARQSLPRIDAYLREGGDSGVADLERARSYAWMGKLGEAARQYTSGARIQTSEARAIYRLDISWVATRWELTAFDSLPADSVGPFIDRFWSKRDVQELRPDGSRLQEHLRRWVYVTQHFRVPDPGRRTAWREVYLPYSGTKCQEKGANTLDDYDYAEPARQGGYRAPERVFDHRGIVYMRHGEPLYRLGGDTASATGEATDRGSDKMSESDAQAARREITGTIRPLIADMTEIRFLDPDRNVTWVYLIGGQVRAFTFLGHQALGTNSASTLVVSAPPNLAVTLQLSELSPAYARLAGVAQSGGTMIPMQCQRAYLDIIDQQRVDAGVAVTTDTYLRRFSRPLNAAIQFATLGQAANGTGLLLTVVGIRTGELVGEPVPGDSGLTSFAVRLQMAAIDSLTGEAIRRDTVRTVVTKRALVEQDAWITLVTAMPLEQGLREIRLSVEQDDDRGSIFSTHLDGAGAGFSLSDLVFGSEHGAVNWRRNGMLVPVTPFSLFGVGEVLPLYYEVYGLTPGAEYKTTISLKRVKDAKVASTITFTDRATAPTLALARSLRLNELKRGSYDLVVTIEDVATGARAVRQRAVSVQAQ